MKQNQSLNEQTNKQKRACVTHKQLGHIDGTLHLHRPWRAPGGGEELCAEGHLPYALRVRPQTKAHQMQAGQAARQPDPSQRGGGEQRARGGGCCVCLCVQACVYVCFCFFLNEEMVAVETFWINL